MGMLDEIGAWLASAPQSVGTLDADLFLAFLPDDPAVTAKTVTVLYETPGVGSMEVFGNGASADGILSERLQVVVRSDSYPTAKTKAEAVRALLRDVNHEVLGGRRYLRIRPLQSAPFPLGGADNQGRWRLACNFEVWRDPA